jgi:hypothetical protein
MSANSHGRRKSLKSFQDLAPCRRIKPHIEIPLSRPTEYLHFYRYRSRAMPPAMRGGPRWRRSQECLRFGPPTNNGAAKQMSGYHLQMAVAYFYIGLLYLFAAHLQIAMAYFYLGFLHLLAALGFHH